MTCERSNNCDMVLFRPFPGEFDAQHTRYKPSWLRLPAEYQGVHIKVGTVEGEGNAAVEASDSLMCACSAQVDLCTGPHLPNTGYLKTSAVNAFNRAFWRADVSKEHLQVRLTKPRLSGFPFPKRLQDFAADFSECSRVDISACCIIEVC